MADDNTDVQDLINTAVEGLKAKNKELLGKLKKATTTISGFEGIDVEQLKKDAKALKELQETSDKEKGEYKKLYEEQSVAHDEVITKIKTERDQAIEQLKSNKKQGALKDALILNHVDPVLIDAASKILKSNLTITDDEAIVADGKPLEDFVKDWAKTDVGKRFVSDGNSGGDANNGGGTVVKEADYFDKKSKNFSKTEQAKIANENPDLYQSLKKQFK